MRRIVCAIKNKTARVMLVNKTGQNKGSDRQTGIQTDRQIDTTVFTLQKTLVEHWGNQIKLDP